MKNTKEKNISSYQKIFLEKAASIYLEEEPELGFVCRSMVSASMPHSKVKGTYYKRKNRNFTLTITGNELAGGVPYGSYPRLILSWISSEAVKTNDREILLGASLSDFMKKTGLLVTGGQWGTLSRFKQQLKALFSSTISFNYEDKKKGEFINTNMNIAEKSQIFWNPKKPSQIDLFKSKVLLGESFFNEITNTPIPVNIKAINALKSSSLALDIYFWLTYRLGYLNHPLNISYDQLQIQFGGNYKNTAQGRYEFKRKFNQQLSKVLCLYPEAKVSEENDGLLLKPSIKHIKSISFKS